MCIRDRLWNAARKRSSQKRAGSRRPTGPMSSDPVHGGARERRRPEILAPAGDRDALAAALAAGADAVYIGLDDGFNARARAENFSSSNLAEVVAWVHRSGARAYVTLN